MKESGGVPQMRGGVGGTVYRNALGGLSLISRLYTESARRISL